MNSFTKVGLFLAGAAVWLGCGYLAYGYALGSFSYYYPDQKQEPFPTVWGYGFGPAALLVAYLEDPYHWQIQENTCQQRWEAFNKNNGILGKDYFLHWAGNGDCKSEDLK